MEKEVESRASSEDSSAVESKSSEYKLIDGKELARLFQKMTVTRTSTPSKSSSNIRDSREWRYGEVKPEIHRVHPASKFKKRTKRIVRKRQNSSPTIVLRPSKLTNLVVNETQKSNPTESPFSTFSADCSRELETIVKASTKKVTKVDKASKSKTIIKDKPQSMQKVPSSRPQKRRKASSCAQQALNPESVNLSIDILTDYLEETILLPKKMSYMAELMYT